VARASRPFAPNQKFTLNGRKTSSIEHQTAARRDVARAGARPVPRSQRPQRHDGARIDPILPEQAQPLRAGTSRGPERDRSPGRSGFDSTIALELPLSRWLHSDTLRAVPARAPLIVAARTE